MDESSLFSGSVDVTMTPLVVFAILDHYMRRSEGQVGSSLLNSSHSLSSHLSHSPSLSSAPGTCHWHAAGLQRRRPAARDQCLSRTSH